MIEYFRNNWTVDNYKKMIKLNRITKKKYELLTSRIIKLQVPLNTYININTDIRLNQKQKILYNKIGTVIEYAFRQSLNFGNFKYIKNDNFVNINHRDTFGPLKIIKYLAPRPSDDELLINFKDVLGNIIDIETLRHDRESENTTLDNTAVITKKNRINTEFKTKYDTLMNTINAKITAKIQQFKNYTTSHKADFKRIKEIQDLISKVKKKLIEIGTLEGYVIELKNGFVAMEKVLDTVATDTYRVHVHYDYNEQKYENPSIEKGNDYVTDEQIKSCLLCKLARTKNWTSILHKTELSHLKGLSNNVSYYEYNRKKDIVEEMGITYQNLFPKNYDFGDEERVLATPFAHIPTMLHNSDCNISSKNYPPHGAKAKGKDYACGALILENVKDAEIVQNLISTIKSAYLYAYFKSGGIRHKVADINYENEGKYYKFIDPEIDHPIKEPKIYIYFHTLYNSEPHLHMHTYIDSSGNSLRKLYEINNRIRYGDLYDLTKFEPSNLPTTYEYFHIGGRVGTMFAEIFGSDYFDRFTDSWDPIRNIPINPDTSDYLVKRFTGEKLQKENEPITSWIKSNSYSNEFGIESSTYDSNYVKPPCASAEYLFKKILGIPDGDPRMKHKYIFPEPDYDLHTLLNFNQHNEFGDLIATEMKRILKEKYIESSGLFYPDAVYTPFTGHKDKGFSKEIDESTKVKVGEIFTNYGLNTDESTISRQSTTDNDNLMVLFMEIALIDKPYIGGYYGHSAPNKVNKFLSITHPEYCLFNSIDYPFKIVKDSILSTCNRNIAYDDARMGRISYNVKFTLYLYRRYICEASINTRISIHTDRLILRNIHDDFMKSDNGIEHIFGGSLPKASSVISENQPPMPNIKGMHIQSVSVPITKEYIVSSPITKESFIPMSERQKTMTLQKIFNQLIIEYNEDIEYYKSEATEEVPADKITSNSDLKMCYAIFIAFIFKSIPSANVFEQV